MKLNSLDYGSGMAYNFFYGYLSLVLSVPEDGTKSKGIRIIFLLTLVTMMLAMGYSSFDKI